MQIDIQHTGLVLEGGGMRGVFTAGVIDYLLDAQIYFPYCVGVSAGACHGSSYISRQRGRAKKSGIDALAKYNYISPRYIFKQHSIMDLELIYDRLPHELLPFDYEAYFRSTTEFEMVTTNCRTGRAMYLSEDHDAQRQLDIVKASAALPYVCPKVYVDKTPMLDGGIVDSIPLLRAQERGYAFNIVVLTRNAGYRKAGKDHELPWFVYPSYPNLRQALSHRNSVYNRQLSLIEEEERKGTCLVIRPQKPMEVERLTTDPEALTRLYNEGYEVAKQVLEAQTLV